MRFSTLLVTTLLSVSVAFAQYDPVVMRIAGNSVPLSEFVYAYHKNYPQEERDDDHLEEFAERYLDYKLKVQAALDAHLDTLTTFRMAYESYLDGQSMSSFMTNPQVETEMRKTYEVSRQSVEARGGMIKVAHILLALRQDATENQRRIAEHKADSIYRALKEGADFSEMAKRYSDDSKSAKDGGELPWIAKGETVERFENVAFALKEGELSRPFLSEFGYHILLLKARQPYFPYDSIKDKLYRQVETRKLREAAMNSKQRTAVAKSTVYREKGPEESLLSREYREGLLLYEITNRTIWEKAGKDEKGLTAYYKRNKKKYKKLLKKGSKNYEDIRPLVLADYLESLEEEWVSSLRKRYSTNIDKNILATINK